MNAMDRLRAARPDYYDSPLDARTRTEELSFAMAQPRTPRPDRLRRRTWDLGLVGVAAATAIAIGVGVGLGGATGLGRGTSGGGETPPGGAVAASSTQGGDRKPAVRLSARKVLLVAAQASLQAPEESGAYWYVESVSGQNDEAGGAARYTVTTKIRHRLWVARSPREESWFVDQNLGTRPAPGSEDAWREDGAPTRWTVAAGDKPGMNLLLEAKAGKPYGNAVNSGDRVFELAGRNVSVADLQTLPSDPAELKRYLLRGYQGHDTESNTPQDADSWLFQVTARLLRDMPVKPAVRAAAYQMLAGLDGVRSLGEVTDAMGRDGLGIARTERRPDGQVERWLIIDPATGILLSEQFVAVDLTGPRSWAKRGTVLHWQATMKAGWTNEKPATPTQ
ncbi:CU044_5270 family protein [Thermopolyspora sp. NPDC052614]|uniref:CU044_5270 family protein n=1 Tax=Thermopolyspora sp. NPDC052614 TaxID=3155682 RepID=UPI00341718CC